MSNTELFLAGVRLLVFGMGMVYVFLLVMIACMKLLEKGCAPFAAKLAAKEAAAATAAAKKPASAGDADSARLAAVAAVAVNMARGK